jgi:hypothetical protein
VEVGVTLLTLVKQWAKIDTNVGAAITLGINVEVLANKTSTKIIIDKTIIDRD